MVDNWAQLNALPPDAVKGKILLFNHQFDKELAAEGQGLDAYVGGVVYRGGGPIAGGAVGAVAVLVRSVGGADFRLPHTGETEYAPDVPKVPAAAVTAEDADLLKVLAGEGPVKTALDVNATNASRRGQLQRDCRLEGNGAPGAGGDRIRASGFVGPGDGRD